ncbi:MAG: sigma factor-like helix-turn-helix DNA-binding protein [Planctomycetota bacterium]
MNGVRASIPSTAEGEDVTPRDLRTVWTPHQPTMTQAQVAKSLGISRSMVYKLETRALNKLRAALLGNNLPASNPTTPNQERVE